MAAKLGAACREARAKAGVHALVIAQAAGVSEATISRFEAGTGWRVETDAIVEAYERECGLRPGTLWRRAVRKG